jgi:nucleotide-binding universal stress UspA family protein
VGASSGTSDDRRIKRWVNAWVHSDLVGIPLTLAVVLIVAVSVGIYLLIGNVAGLFVGKLVFICALVALIGFILVRTRPSPSTTGIRPAPSAGPRRALVVANEGLRSPQLCAAICDRGFSEARIVVPVAASSRMRSLSDDVDEELGVAGKRLEGALATLRAAGIEARGHVDIGPPMRCLLDGLREFQASDVVMLRGGERGWEGAEEFAQRVHDEVGLEVTEVDTRPSLTGTGAAEPEESSGTRASSG